MNRYLRCAGRPCFIDTGQGWIDYYPTGCPDAVTSFAKSEPVTPPKPAPMFETLVQCQCGNIMHFKGTEIPSGTAISAFCQRCKGKDAGGPERLKDQIPEGWL